MYKLPENIKDYVYSKDKVKASDIVLLRADLDVAIDEYGMITEPQRMESAIPFIKQLGSEVKKVIIVAHLGRPERKEDKFNFKNDIFLQLVKRIPELQFATDIEHAGVYKEGIILLQNIRFFEGEESEDEKAREVFAKKLAGIADIFINNAFAAYRVSASTYDVAKYIPTLIGPDYYNEIEAIGRIENPERPFIAVLGGAKLSEKLDSLAALGELADKILIGGAMAYTLMRAKGIEVGRSKVEYDKLEVAEEILKKYEDKLLLPQDHIVTETFSAVSVGNKSGETISDEDNIEKYDYAIDIGDETLALYEEEIRKARTILWNGPMGVFEWNNGSHGTRQLGLTMSQLTSAYTLVGGGDTIAAINKFGLDNFDHICSGGGALLNFIGETKFPTLDVIVQQKALGKKLHLKME